MNMRMGVLLAGLVAVPIWAAGAPDPGKYTVTEMLLGDAVPSTQTCVSADGEHYIGIAPEGDGQRVIVDGQPQLAWTRVYTMSISEDGKRVCYFATKEQHSVLVSGGRVSREYTFAGRIKAHPTTARMMCSVRYDKGRFLYVDGEEFGPYDQIEPIDFSPSGTSWAASVRKGETWVTLVNGKAVPASAKPTQFTFSPDGKHYGYVATTPKGAEAVYVDGERQVEYTPEAGLRKESPITARRETVLFSPDSKRVAYCWRKPDGQWTYNVDGGNQPSGEVVGYFSFSPTGRGFCYVAIRKNAHWAIVDGREYGPYEYASAPRFSQDGKHVYYAALHDGKYRVLLNNTSVAALPEGARPSPVIPGPNGQRALYVFRKGDQSFFGVNDKVFGPFGTVVHCPYGAWRYDGNFSPDGKHFACTVQRGDKWLQVIDGKETDEYEATWPVSFGPKPEQYAYVVREDGKYSYLQQDGTRSRGYDRVTLFHTPRGQLVCTVTDDKGWRVLIDGKPGQTFEGVYDLRLDAKGTLVYRCKRNGGFYVVIGRQLLGPYEQQPSQTVTDTGKIRFIAVKDGKVYRVRCDPPAAAEAKKGA